MKIRKTVSVLVICALCLLAGTPVVALAQARPQAGIMALSNNIERLWGNTLYQTMQEIALKFNPGISKAVVLASGANFPDSLAGVPLAKQKNAPLLLVNKTPETSPEAFAYIDNHLDKKGDIYILGGTAVIPDSFVQALQSRGYTGAQIHRLAGQDRYETAVAVAEAIQNDGTEFYVATGDQFPDALSASVLAATAQTVSADKSAYLQSQGTAAPVATGGIPLLLVPSGGPIPAGVINYLNTVPVTNSNVAQTIHIIGGPGAVPDSSLAQLASQVHRLAPGGINRISGADRYETMEKENANAFDLSWQNNGKGLPVPHIYLATGENYPDALAGAVLAARDNAPIVLINDSLPDPAKNLLLNYYTQNAKAGGQGTMITVLGGEGVVSAATVRAVNALFNSGQSMTGQAQIWTLAGSGIAGAQDGQGQGAMFTFPAQAVEAPDGTIYVSDSKNHMIRAISPGGTVTTVTGSSKGKDQYGLPLGGYADGSSKTALFNDPRGLAVDGNGNLYVADFGNGAIRVVDKNGNVRTLVKGLITPAGLALGSAGVLYVSETLNHRILKVLPDGTWSVLAGGGYAKKDDYLVGGYADGKGEAAQFNEPAGLAWGPDGVLYVADAGNQRIRAVTPDGVVSTVAGSGSDVIPGTTYIAGGFADGPATEARFNFPAGLAVGPDGTLYVADTYNQRIRTITDGTVKTLAGNGNSGKTDGLLAQAEFSGPTGIVVLKNNNLLVVDQWNQLIREIQPGSQGQPGK